MNEWKNTQRHHLFTSPALNPSCACGGLRLHAVRGAHRKEAPCPPLQDAHSAGLHAAPFAALRRPPSLPSARSGPRSPRLILDTPLHPQPVPASAPPAEPSPTACGEPGSQGTCHHIPGRALGGASLGSRGNSLSLRCGAVCRPNNRFSACSPGQEAAQQVSPPNEPQTFLGIDPSLSLPDTARTVDGLPQSLSQGMPFLGPSGNPVWWCGTVASLLPGRSPYLRPGCRTWVLSVIEPCHGTLCT